MDSIEKILTLEQHMSQKELANRLGVTTATIRNWKKQGQIPKQAQQQKLNRVYGANKRYITDDTITKAERKIREYDVKAVFEVRHQKAAKQAKHIEGASAKNKFIAEAGNLTAFYSGDGQRAQFMGAEDTGQGIKAGINGVTVYGVVRAYISTDDESSYDYMVSYKLPIDVKNDMEFDEALNRIEKEFFTHHIPNTKKNQNHVPYQFLGYKIDYHRERKSKRKK